MKCFILLFLLSSGLAFSQIKFPNGIDASANGVSLDLVNCNDKSRVCSGSYVPLTGAGSTCSTPIGLKSTFSMVGNQLMVTGHGSAFCNGDDTIILFTLPMPSDNAFIEAADCSGTGAWTSQGFKTLDITASVGSNNMVRIVNRDSTPNAIFRFVFTCDMGTL